MSRVSSTPHTRLMAVIGMLQDHILAIESGGEKKQIWGTHAMETTSLELAVDMLIGLLDDVPDGRN